MLMGTQGATRDLGQLTTILGVLIRQGLDDAVRRIGLADSLELDALAWRFGTRRGRCCQRPWSAIGGNATRWRGRLSTGTPWPDSPSLLKRKIGVASKGTRRATVSGHFVVDTGK